VLVQGQSGGVLRHKVSRLADRKVKRKVAKKEKIPLFANEKGDDGLR
jgi:hypothetical protein